MPFIRLCLHEEKLPLVGGLPWPSSQLLAGVHMGEKKVAPLWFDSEGTGKLYFFLAKLLYSCTLLGLKSTELNSHGHLHCFKQLIKDSVIAEVKAHLLRFHRWLWLWFGICCRFKNNKVCTYWLYLKLAFPGKSKRDKVFTWQKVVSPPSVTLPCKVSNPNPRVTLPPKTTLWLLM